MYRSALILSILLVVPAVAQQPSANAIPLKPSIARAKKWWNLDCAMCHGASGEGKGDIAKDMKLNIADFTNASTLKDCTDGEIYYVIKNGHNDMPGEGPRIKTEEGWDLVNCVRSLPKASEAKAQ